MRRAQLLPLSCQGPWQAWQVHARYIVGILIPMDEAQLLKTYRRFGEFGPVYQVLAFRSEGAKRVAEIEVVESGEKVTLPLDQVQASPEAK